MNSLVQAELLSDSSLINWLNHDDFSDISVASFVLAHRRAIDKSFSTRSVVDCV